VAGTPNSRDNIGASRSSFEPRHGEAPARWHVVNKPSPARGRQAVVKSQHAGTSQRYEPGSLPSRPGPQRLLTIGRIRRGCSSAVSHVALSGWPSPASPSWPPAGNLSRTRHRGPGAAARPGLAVADRRGPLRRRVFRAAAGVAGWVSDGRGDLAQRAGGGCWPSGAFSLSGPLPVPGLTAGGGAVPAGRPAGRGGPGRAGGRQHLAVRPRARSCRGPALGDLRGARAARPARVSVAGFGRQHLAARRARSLGEELPAEGE
jgi:hypothetical protein